MLLLGGLKIIMVIIKGMRDRGLRRFLTPTLPSTWTTASISCSFWQLCCFQGPFTPSSPSVAKLLSLAGLSLVGFPAFPSYEGCPVYKQEKWVSGSMQLNYNPAFWFSLFLPFTYSNQTRQSGAHCCVYIGVTNLFIFLVIDTLLDRLF